ncbi:MAG: DUF4337 domain-containing protein [Gemmatimonadota bacterium]|nr:DUF4337 domain-containing protein [Gemmatimonadota bacterium]
MEINPMESAPESAETRGAAHGRLNSLVAITVALLATFMGVCKVKDDNIVQAMQQSQADRVDHWSFYQARNLREEVARATADQLRAQAVVLPAGAKTFLASAARYDSIAANEFKKKAEVRTQAEGDQKMYDLLNYRDDQFDLADAMAAIAISLLAVTSLTNKRWLFFVALVPTAFAVLMGLAGLLRWQLHSATLAQWLS